MTFRHRTRGCRRTKVSAFLIWVFGVFLLTSIGSSPVVAQDNQIVLTDAPDVKISFTGWGKKVELPPVAMSFSGWGKPVELPGVSISFIGWGKAVDLPEVKMSFKGFGVEEITSGISLSFKGWRTEPSVDSKLSFLGVGPGPDLVFTLRGKQEVRTLIPAPSLTEASK